MAIKARILKGDTVMVRRGKEKGKRGTVKAVQAEHGTATVEGINIVKRHTKQGREVRQHGRNADRRHHREGVGDAALGAAVRLREVQGADALASRTHGRRTCCVAVCARCGEPARESAKGA